MQDLRHKRGNLNNQNLDQVAMAAWASGGARATFQIAHPPRWNFTLRRRVVSIDIRLPLEELRVQNLTICRLLEGLIEGQEEEEGQEQIPASMVGERAGVEKISSLPGSGMHQVSTPTDVVDMFPTTCTAGGTCRVRGPLQIPRIL
mmetsp:Transcript_30486/g.98263  ORF Transcript_30486/g.98263 Transcript_30486/m.98263 type:complete len:146 (-) Transcript_30486:2870-3307(-)